MGAIPAQASTKRHNPTRADRVFFCVLVTLIAATVFLGFAKTYFFAGLLAAKLPSPLVHVHGALFIAWIFLLAAQIVLIATGHVRWHIKIGNLVVFLAPVMVVVGFATLVAFIRRPGNPPLPILRIITAVDTLTLIVFGFLVLMGYLARYKSAAHKRFMLLGTITIIGPAIARLPFPLITSSQIGFLASIDFFIILIALYDFWRMRSLHRATVYGVLLTMAWQAAYLPLANSAMLNRAVVSIQKR